MRGKLIGKAIPFRAAMTGPNQAYRIGGPIAFPDGTKGVIIKIRDVDWKRDGRVYVIGQYREVQ
ncbi:hypothetical protein ACFSL6_08860 [Paenibacillus thailandensis]|uniref:Uncharacterized protein n=1 Tax=Paenibacillus thailandensis TaxID=393250 RepID=A0ABW5QTL8_9BACL